VAEPMAILTRLPEMQIATLAAFKGRATALSEAVGAAWGAPLPEPLRWTQAGPLALFWTGPERWLVTAPPGPDLEAQLEAAVGALAAITDQSAGRTGWRLSGPGARDVLAKLVGLDLHPRAFGPGHTATTIAAHIGLQLWQIDETPSYGLMVARSLTESFEHALTAAAR
jgi:heterotetrameric sarcosine oxidase gamma subunit